MSTRSVPSCRIFEKNFYKNVIMVEGSLTTKISYETGKRPKKAERSGSGNYCSMSDCKNTQFKVDNKAKIKTGVGFFLFPKSPKRRKECLQSISRFRQRGGKDKFNVNNTHMWISFWLRWHECFGNVTR